MEIFITPGELAACDQYDSAQDYVEAAAVEDVDLAEGAEFRLVRITVGAATLFKIVDGKPVPVAVSFPQPAGLKGG